MESHELRCPVGPGRLLLKLLYQDGHPEIVNGNLVELACSDCKRTLRKQGRPVARVLHRFNLAGELVESIFQE